MDMTVVTAEKRLQQLCTSLHSAFIALKQAQVPLEGQGDIRLSQLTSVKRELGVLERALKCLKEDAEHIAGIKNRELLHLPSLNGEGNVTLRADQHTRQLFIDKVPYSSVGHALKCVREQLYPGLEWYWHHSSETSLKSIKQKHKILNDLKEFILRIEQLLGTLSQLANIQFQQEQKVYTYDFYLSFAISSYADRVLAQALGTCLEDAGYTVANYEDVQVGSSRAEATSKLIAASARCIALLSPAYWKDEQAMAEPYRFLRGAPIFSERHLLPLRIAPFPSMFEKKLFTDIRMLRSLDYSGSSFDTFVVASPSRQGFLHFIDAWVSMETEPKQPSTGHVLLPVSQEQASPLSGASEVDRFCDGCGAANRTGARFCYLCGMPLVQQAPALAPLPAQPALVSATHTTATLLKELPVSSVLQNRYVIQRKLGAGGMGAVYQAVDKTLGDRSVAIKEMLPPQILTAFGMDISEAIASFAQEAFMLAKLKHPNLPRVYEYFVLDDRQYLVMDYIEGVTLEKYLASQEAIIPLSVRQSLKIVLQLCDVLAYLHAQTPPIIFRDLKPGNIMLTMHDNQVYLIDFGIARHFKPAQRSDTLCLGTPGYASPEHYGRGQTSPASDVYGLGALLHWLLTAEDPAATPFCFSSIVTASPFEDLGTLIKCMTDVNPGNRVSISEIQHTLQCMLRQ